MKKIVFVLIFISLVFIAFLLRPLMVRRYCSSTVGEISGRLMTNEIKKINTKYRICLSKLGSKAEDLLKE